MGGMVRFAPIPTTAKSMGLAVPWGDGVSGEWPSQLILHFFASGSSHSILFLQNLLAAKFCGIHMLTLWQWFLLNFHACHQQLPTVLKVASTFEIFLPTFQKITQKYGRYLHFETPLDSKMTLHSWICLPKNKYQRIHYNITTTFKRDSTCISLYIYICIAKAANLVSFCNLLLQKTIS